MLPQNALMQIYSIPSSICNIVYLKSSDIWKRYAYIFLYYNRLTMALKKTHFWKEKAKIPEGISYRCFMRSKP